MQSAGYRAITILLATWFPAFCTRSRRHSRRHWLDCWIEQHLLYLRPQWKTNDLKTTDARPIHCSVVIHNVSFPVYCFFQRTNAAGLSCKILFQTVIFSANVLNFFVKALRHLYDCLFFHFDVLNFFLQFLVCFFQLISSVVHRVGWTGRIRDLHNMCLHTFLRWLPSRGGQLSNIWWQ